ncbi:hypothetical protein [Paraglaciecola arctica]|uniref:Uncharacterized protein n=1 Tax=Paraglaciecola arctica BSs20135 TaxID=493475 RepID=K6Y637_9ALTE|nr:hypothetical protein [Paraglaciecola arctica]GAC19406.1 hypothetical protein GARC_2440 [Paraglaciecola arctica BSs20135]
MLKHHKIDYEWQMYRKNILVFLSELKSESFIKKDSAEALTSHIHLLWSQVKEVQTAKEAFKLLKLYIAADKLEVFRTRYRSYKYRSKNNRKTVVVSEFIRQRLTDTMKSINSESVDECLDYLMSELYVEHRDEAINEIRDNIYGNEEGALHSLMQRISLRDKEIIKANIEASFIKGWEASTTSISKKSDAKLLARDQYVEKQVLSKLMEDGKLIASARHK